MHVVESLTQCKLFVHISQGLPTPERLFERVDNAIHLVCHLSPICENEIVEGLKTQIKFIKVFAELDKVLRQSPKHLFQNLLTREGCPVCVLMTAEYLGLKNRLV